MNTALIKSLISNPDLTLVAVSKTRSVEQILEAHELGVVNFGENRVQELLSKQALIEAPIQWHLIGHLQKNKVKQVVPFIHMIHSVDSFKLLNKIQNEAAKKDRQIRVLLQFKIAQEETKFGFDYALNSDNLKSLNVEDYPNIRFCGVMAMASFVSHEEQIRSEFKQLKHIFDELKASSFSKEEQFKEISMGMSGDYQIAIEEGSTMLRIGSLIFN